MFIVYKLYFKKQYLKTFFYLNMHSKDLNVFATTIDVLGIYTDNVAIYFTIILVYVGLIGLKHKLDTTSRQYRRELLITDKKARNVYWLILYRILHEVCNILFVLFVASNNFGFLMASIVGHAVGVAMVFEYQPKDHRHPLRALANALKFHNKKDKEAAEELEYILDFFRKHLKKNKDIKYNF